MAAIKVSQAVQDTAKTELSATFNSALAEACYEFGLVPSGETAPSIDFDDPGVSFFEADLALDDLAFALEQWPSESQVSVVMALFVPRAADQKLSRPRTFSGPVQLGIRIFLRWPPADPDSITKPISNAARVANAIESAVLYSMQHGEGGGAAIAWGAGITKQGGFSEERGGLLLGDEGAWFQQLDFTFGFQVSI